MQFMWGEGAKGLWVGALLGALVGLGVCTWVIDVRPRPLVPLLLAM